MQTDVGVSTKGVPSMQIDGQESVETSLDQKHVRELTCLYFEKVHEMCPVLCPSTYMASLFLPSPLCPPLCLQLIVMALAASISKEQMSCAISLYHRSRGYAEDNDIANLTDSPSLPHVQCWLLLANFEAQQAVFSRASMSFTRSVRGAQMLQMHRIDVDEIDVLATTPAYILEKEEWRRTWWAIFNTDRFLSATTGWPLLINEHDVLTRLPASERAICNGQFTHLHSLQSLLRQDIEPYSTLTSRVLIAQIFHTAMQQSSAFSLESPLELNNGEYWEKHRAIEQQLTKFQASLPHELRLFQSYGSTEAAFINAMVQASSISLHQCAIWRMHRLGLPIHMMEKSRKRLLVAAEQVVRILKATPDLDVAMRNPILAFSASMAALALLEDFAANSESDGDEGVVFILNIMATIGKENAVTRSLAQQLYARMKEMGVYSVSDEQVNAFAFSIERITR
ncbi:uncharacterized protein JN550_012948 [Neoarthrinium moseri]|uniref:uncharacterized protein n=1 Tax=Neoarthrinium moseri TaxID=1658444 RepID=UPI001FDE7183|nr:uncharacterized protein JN550_012948 [Neoarthrinium moseri]KAI1857873.1 hypothetical protein JN550_012948 [Neoarthrinium moseri]